MRPADAMGGVGTVSMVVVFIVAGGGLALRFPVVPSFGTDMASHLTVHEEGVAIIAPWPSEIDAVHTRGGDEPAVVEHTKKKSIYGNRVLPLGRNGIALIREVLRINEENSFQDGDYLFLGEKGTRITSRAVDNRIRKLCARAGIKPAKSAHDIRRTVATRLYRSTHDVELIRQFLGHSDVKTTWGYIVNVDAEKEDRRRIVEALQGNSGDAGTKIVDFAAYRKKGASRGRTGGKKSGLVSG